MTETSDCLLGVSIDRFRDSCGHSPEHNRAVLAVYKRSIAENVGRYRGTLAAMAGEDAVARFRECGQAASCAWAIQRQLARERMDVGVKLVVHAIIGAPTDSSESFEIVSAVRNNLARVSTGAVYLTNE